MWSRVISSTIPSSFGVCRISTFFQTPLFCPGPCNFSSLTRNSSYSPAVWRAHLQHLSFFLPSLPGFSWQIYTQFLHEIQSITDHLFTGFCLWNNMYHNITNRSSGSWMSYVNYHERWKSCFCCWPILGSYSSMCAMIFLINQMIL